MTTTTTERMIAMLQEKIATLTSERDEARILYCRQLSPADPHKIAEKWRWNCFKNEQESCLDALNRINQINEEMST